MPHPEHPSSKIEHLPNGLITAYSRWCTMEIARAWADNPTEVAALWREVDRCEALAARDRTRAAAFASIRLGGA